jgi:hypothetical protein
MNSKRAISILHEQIVTELLGKSGPAKIRCFLIKDWIITHNSGVLTIRGPASDHTRPQKPSWIDYSYSEELNEFSVRFETEPYLFDGMGFVLQTWRGHLNNPNEDFEYHMREALLAISRRWKMQAEPLSENDQKGLIGELRCVLAAYNTPGIGLEAIESWDPSGDELYDIDSINWVIECKATSSEPEVVRISYPEQVDFTISKTLVLGVTKVNKDKKQGSTFPEVVKALLSEHETLPLSHLSKLQSVLAGRGYTPGMAEKFTTKWIVGNTRFLSITEESNVLPCSILADLPTTVKHIKYSLNTSQFPESELSTLIGG